jgi:hypothetical protein
MELLPEFHKSSNLLIMNDSFAALHANLSIKENMVEEYNQS